MAENYLKIGKKFYGYDKKILFKVSLDKNYLKDSPTRRCPDLTTAKKLIKYKTKINLEEGIKKYLEYLKNEKL